MSRPRITNPVPRSAAALLALLLVAGGCNHRTEGAAKDSASAGSTDINTAQGEQLRLVPPATWALTSASKQGPFARAQYLRPPPDSDGQPPGSQAVTETLTLEQLDPDGLSDPLAFLENLAAEQAQRCDDFNSIVISSGFENGYPSAVRLLRCPRRRVNNTASVSMAKAIAGNDRYYLLVFEKRAAAAGSEPLAHVSESDIASWSLYLRQATVCDSRDREHPCTAPSPATQRAP
ncbi:MAG: hypothetical protein AAGI15_02820 [Pseudomonadota bacterium]